MSPLELRASISLASIYGLRMLGMFLILPIFAIYAEALPGGHDHLLIGLALGAYGLTQAIFQLPFGMASDRFGRKRLIYIGLLIFVIGSGIAACAQDIQMLIIGRAIQGAGAISAAVTALLADLTREQYRTQAMAMVGATIGVTFAASLVLAPVLNQWIGVSGIFMMTAVLAALAILVVRFLVPDPVVSRFHSDAGTAPAQLKHVLQHPQLLRLNFGIFALHAAQMAMFIVVPFAIKEASGMSENHHWQVYLPVVLIGFVLMVPAIIYGEKKARLKQVFVTGIAIMLIAQLLFASLLSHFWGIVASLVLYFLAFNVLEAILPSMISKIAPAASKGTAMGVFNTTQSLGVFVGGILGGYLSSLSYHHGYQFVFIFCSIMMLAWLLLAITMQAPPAVRSRMFHLPEGRTYDAQGLGDKLAVLPGVKESVVLPEEGVIILKVDMQPGFDESEVLRLIKE